MLKGQHKTHCDKCGTERKFTSQGLIYPKQENEHNALADARWNKKLYEFLKQL